MTLGRIAWLVGVAVLVMIANVGVTIVYMVIYGHVLDPGHPEQYYHDHVQIAAPYCAIAGGIPLFFFAGWWVAGWWDSGLGAKAAATVWLAYLLIDGVLLLAAQVTPGLSFAISFLTKLAAVWLGAAIRGRPKPQGVL
jgi:hypothetical protein